MLECLCDYINNILRSARNNAASERSPYLRMNGPMQRGFQAVRRLAVALMHWLVGLVEIHPGGSELQMETSPGGEPSELVSERAAADPFSAR